MFKLCVAFDDVFGELNRLLLLLLFYKLEFELIGLESYPAALVAGLLNYLPVGGLYNVAVLSKVSMFSVWVSSFAF